MHQRPPPPLKKWCQILSIKKIECWVIFLHSHYIFECMLGLYSIGVCKNAFREGEGQQLPTKTQQVSWGFLHNDGIRF